MLVSSFFQTSPRYVLGGGHGGCLSENQIVHALLEGGQPSDNIKKNGIKKEQKIGDRILIAYHIHQFDFLDSLSVFFTHSLTSSPTQKATEPRAR